ncbi:hypothetical protein CEN45_10040 [Fischerella thermalis CCMEE 5198]|jgi:hypothetical protein|uniref:Uncharacterized protein n=2 Tax=Fischerella TaxID=1190 RepID=A0A2N6JV23_FISMU|nr:MULTISPECIES: hypothetical protein [Fischerella]PMB02383.1 hypothetical protein CI594_07650 [Fischerella thermalis CCMEE 5196]PMB43616.1 hypothetical protein CEN40_15520 [Fischerella thermalis CCMEE 5205]PMB53859.1 hypothetical protein CEN39_02175 [Fischerella thermalis CCMEE 5201]MBD2435114.1 hypothetical protein [Fischerella sp. FACHB-380]PLZ21043.1 hypothetical protein CBP28_22815 [Fischerella thermalis WC559]
MNFEMPLVVSPSFARFVALEVEPNSLRKKDIIKCLKALEIKNPEVLNLKWKEELWSLLQTAAKLPPMSLVKPVIMKYKSQACDSN